MQKPYSIFLDDERVPTDVKWIRLPHKQWTIVRSYKAFTDLITKMKAIPDYVTYDHDLADITRHTTEKTGYDCAKWLVNYCMDATGGAIKHPPYSVHSLNPVGGENISQYIDKYNKYIDL